MAPPVSRAISRKAFVELVKENIDDLGLDPDEALKDAIQTLTLQGADLSGVRKCIPGMGSVKDNPVIQFINELKSIFISLVTSNSKELPGEDKNDEKLVELLNEVCQLCYVAGSENATVAARKGGMEALTSLCSSLDCKFERTLALGLKALSLIVSDLQSSELFCQCGGNRTVMDILHGSPKSLDIQKFICGFASTRNEVVKKLFMELKVDELLVEAVKEQSNDDMQNLYDAIHVILTSDDGRVAASQVFTYARTFAKVRMADALVNSLRKGVGYSCLPSACTALKAVAVNDEICKSISGKDEINVILQGIDESGEQGNMVIAKFCCSLLSKLAGSDANKIAIVQKGGIERLITLSSRFSDDPSVQEMISIMTNLSLRLSENAARAIQAGMGDLTFELMKNYPTPHQMQRQACLMIRNLVVRNPKNRTILLNGGIETLIRRAMGLQGCQDATTALRDLGSYDYNV